MKRARAREGGGEGGRRTKEAWVGWWGAAGFKLSPLSRVKSRGAQPKGSRFEGQEDRGETLGRRLVIIPSCTT